MIKETTLMRGIEYRIKNGQDLSLQKIVDLVSQKAEQYNIEIAFKWDKIAPDLIAGLLGDKQDCLVLYHPKFEKTYLRYIVQINHRGTYAFISVNKTNGFSPKSTFYATNEGFRSGLSGSYKQREDGWYAIIDDIFKELFGAGIIAIIAT